MRGFWLNVGLAVAAVVSIGLSGGCASAQGAIQQSGPVVPFHAPVWFQNGVVADAGTPQSPFLNSLGLFNGASCPFGISSQTGPGVSLTPGAQTTICQTSTATTFNFLGLNGQDNPQVIFNIAGTPYNMASLLSTVVPIINLAPATAVHYNDLFACSQGPGDSTNVTYKCTLAQQLGYVDIAWFGASPGASAATNSAAITSAFSFAKANGYGKITGRAGNYNVNPVISLSAPGNFRFEVSGGPGSLNLQATSPTQDILDIASDQTFSLEGIGFTGYTGVGGATAGSCLKITGVASYNPNARINNLVATSCYDSVNAANAAQFGLTNFNIQTYINSGVTVNNTSSGDIGDSYISNGTFNDYGFVGIAIVQGSSGGLRLNDIKMNFGGGGYAMNLISGIQTTILEASDVSVENMANGPAFSFTNSGGALSSFAKVSLSNVQADCYQSLLSGLSQVCAGAEIQVNNGSSLGWMSQFSVTGSNIYVPSGGFAYVLNSAQNLSITGGLIGCVTGSCTGIATGATATGIISGVNNQATTAYSLAGTGVSYSGLNGTTTTYAGGTFLGPVLINNTPVGAAPLSIFGQASNFVIGAAGGGNNYIDGANTYFRTYGGTIYSTITGGGAFFTGAVQAGTYLRSGSATVAALATVDPSPQTADIISVSDATTCTANTTPTGGGSTTCALIYSGAAWKAIVTH